jgi:hypothetical protein
VVQERETTGKAWGGLEQKQWTGTWGSGFKWGVYTKLLPEVSQDYFDGNIKDHSVEYRIDWDGNESVDSDGFYNCPYANVTEYVLHGSCDKAKDAGIGIFKVATFAFTLENESKIFSPFNEDSPLYGKITDGKRVQIIMRIHDTKYTPLPRTRWTGFDRTWSGEALVGFVWGNTPRDDDVYFILNRGRIDEPIPDSGNQTVEITGRDAGGEFIDYIDWASPIYEIKTALELTRIIANSKNLLKNSGTWTERALQVDQWSRLGKMTTLELDVTWVDASSPLPHPTWGTDLTWGGTISASESGVGTVTAVQKTFASIPSSFSGKTSNYVEINATGDLYGIKQFYQPMNVDKNNPYSLQIKMKAESASYIGEEVRIIVMGLQTYTNIIDETITLTEDWTLYEYENKDVVGNCQAQLILQALNGSGTIIYHAGEGQFEFGTECTPFWLSWVERYDKYRPSIELDEDSFQNVEPFPQDYIGMGTLGAWRQMFTNTLQEELTEDSNIQYQPFGFVFIEGNGLLISYKSPMTTPGASFDSLSGLLGGVWVFHQSYSLYIKRYTEDGDELGGGYLANNMQYSGQAMLNETYSQLGVRPSEAKYGNNMVKFFFSGGGSKITVDGKDYVAFLGNRTKFSYTPYLVGMPGDEHIDYWLYQKGIMALFDIESLEYTEDYLLSNSKGTGVYPIDILWDGNSLYEIFLVGDGTTCSESTNLTLQINRCDDISGGDKNNPCAISSTHTFSEIEVANITQTPRPFIGSELLTDSNGNGILLFVFGLSEHNTDYDYYLCSFQFYTGQGSSLYALGDPVIAEDSSGDKIEYATGSTVSGSNDFVDANGYFSSDLVNCFLVKLSGSDQGTYLITGYTDVNTLVIAAGGSFVSWATTEGAISYYIFGKRYADNEVENKWRNNIFVQSTGDIPCNTVGLSAGVTDWKVAQPFRVEYYGGGIAKAFTKILFQLTTEANVSSVHEYGQYRYQLDNYNIYQNNEESYNHDTDAVDEIVKIIDSDNNAKVLSSTGEYINGGKNKICNKYKIDLILGMVAFFEPLDFGNKVYCDYYYKVTIPYFFVNKGESLMSKLIGTNDSIAGTGHFNIRTTDEGKLLFTDRANYFKREKCIVEGGYVEISERIDSQCISEATGLSIKDNPFDGGTNYYVSGHPLNKLKVAGIADGSTVWVKYTVQLHGHYILTGLDHIDKPNIKYSYSPAKAGKVSISGSRMLPSNAPSITSQLYQILPSTIDGGSEEQLISTKIQQVNQFNGNRLVDYNEVERTFPTDEGDKLIGGLSGGWAGPNKITAEDSFKANSELT